MVHIQKKKKNKGRELAEIPTLLSLGWLRELIKMTMFIFAVVSGIESVTINRFSASRSNKRTYL